MARVIEINGICYDADLEFADKQVVDKLIIDFKDEIKRLDNIVNTQNNLINNLKKWEKQITYNFLSLRKEITDAFIYLKKENGKTLKNTKINKANHFLLEDKFNRKTL